MREEWYGSSHPLVAEIYDALASLSCSDAAESPDVTAAEEMFRQALHMREDLLGASHLLVANTLFKLGQYWVCFDTYLNRTKTKVIALANGPFHVFLPSS